MHLPPNCARSLTRADRCAWTKNTGGRSWCIHVTVHFDAADELGYPTPTESAAVEEFAGALLAHLRLTDAVIEAARLTGHGAREYWWYVREPDPMHVLLTEYAAQPELFRAFDYDIALDADWEVLDRFSPGHE